MFKLNLYYHHISNKNFKTEDYFADILSEIDACYPHSYVDGGIIYVPVEFMDMDDAIKKGYQLIDKKTHLGDVPHYIIRELIITFTGINRDYEQDRDHLIELYGKKAFKYQIIEEGIINV